MNIEEELSIIESFEKDFVVFCQTKMAIIMTKKRGSKYK